MLECRPVTQLGRSKPWKISLTADKAREIYKLRPTNIKSKQRDGGRQKGRRSFHTPGGASARGSNRNGAASGSANGGNGNGGGSMGGECMTDGGIAGAASHAAAAHSDSPHGGSAADVGLVGGEGEEATADCGAEQDGDSLRAGNISINFLAETYGVHPKTIRDIWNRDSWKVATKSLWTQDEINNVEERYTHAHTYTHRRTHAHALQGKIAIGKLEI